MSAKVAAAKAAESKMADDAFNQDNEREPVAQENPAPDALSTELEAEREEAAPASGKVPRQDIINPKYALTRLATAARALGRINWARMGVPEGAQMLADLVALGAKMRRPETAADGRKVRAGAPAVGSQVVVRAKNAKVYDGILEPGPLTVQEVRGAMLKCRSAEGDVVMLPAKHLEPAPAG
jgi:hypothetical protein